MSQHARYVNAVDGSPRVQLKFTRQDLLFRHAQKMASPFEANVVVEELPILLKNGRVIGPTVLDMIKREVRKAETEQEDDVPALPAPAAQPAASSGSTSLAITAPAKTKKRQRRHFIIEWAIRDVAELWQDPDQMPIPLTGKDDDEREPDHPFIRGLVSGGTPAVQAEDSEDDAFVRVTKQTTVSISMSAYRLAIGMAGNVADAYEMITKIAEEYWRTDLDRARALYDRIKSEPASILIERTDNPHPQIAHLRPVSSVSQAVETEIMQRVCLWLGVDPTLTPSRRAGRPKRDPRFEGKVLRVTLMDNDTRSRAEMIADYAGLKRGTDLGDVYIRDLISLLGQMRIDTLDEDAGFLEAYLDSAAPNWRQHVEEDEPQRTDFPFAFDPYEILHVKRTDSMDMIKASWRQMQQRLHPDKGVFSPWHAQVINAALAAIKAERGEQ